MLIWIVGTVLVILAALIGFFLGAVRTSICLVATVVAAYTAKLVGGWVSGLVPMLGFTNPIWPHYLPPLLGFVIVAVVGGILGLVVHHLIQRHYRDNTDEYTYARWFRLNRRSGAALGTVLGSVWFLLVGIVAYLPGYLTTQVADSEEPSFLLNTATSLTRGMGETGMNRIVERFQPASANHFLASDILGLVYNNPSLESRLANYPPFLGYAEKPEVAELARDPELQTMIQSRAGATRILEHEKVRAVIDNPELVQELLDLDFKDLNEYLRTGVSEKYKEERILGRWRLNVRRSIAEMKNISRDQLPAVEFNLLRRALNVYLEQLTIGFTTDNRSIIKVKAKDEQKLLQLVGGSSVGSAGAAAASGGTPSPDGSEPAPGPLSSGVPVYGQRAPAKPSATTALVPVMSPGEGSWSRGGEGYTLQFSANGKELAMEAVVNDSQLIARHNGRILVFDRM